MTDEPNKETPESSEEPQDESAPPAGPVADGDPPTHPSEGSPSTPPAEESEAESTEAPAAEEEASAEGDQAEAPAAEQPAAEEKPAAEKPAEKEKKADVIPGADLEPIAVEEEKRELSAEEKARLEAEEEERAAREAELVGETGEEEPSAAGRALAKMESSARYLATGKRKRSVARVTLLPGSGKIEVNQRALEEFFPRPLHQTMARQPLTITGYESSVDVRVRVHGGGVSGQAGAVRHGISRALTEVDPALRAELKRRGFLTRDARVKERRKAGLKKARKRPQFSKR